MNYTINQLRIFLKIVETKSITRASEELFMTQPAVSIQLKKFQEQFDVALTELVGRSIQITDFGYEISAISSRILDEMEELQFKTKEYLGKMAGRLKISSASTGKYVIPYFLTGFLAEHPGIDLLLDVTNKTRVLESLKYNEIDFAIVSVVPEDLEVEQEILVENRLYLVGGDTQFNEEKKLIFRESGSATRQEMEEYFQDHDKGKRKRLELTSNETVKQAVMAGIGYSILPLIGIKEPLERGAIKIIPSEGLPLKTDWRIIWLKNKKLSPVASAYLEFLRQHKDKILEQHFKWYLDFDK